MSVSTLHLDSMGRRVNCYSQIRLLDIKNGIPCVEPLVNENIQILDQAQTRKDAFQFLSHNTGLGIISERPLIFEMYMVRGWCDIIYFIDRHFMKCQESRRNGSKTLDATDDTIIYKA